MGFPGTLLVIESKKNISRPVLRVVVLQLMIAAGFTLLVAIFTELHNAWPAAYGGGVAVMGSLVYALFILRAPDNAEGVLKAHVRAEMVKIFITAVLFMLALVLFRSAAWLWLISGFAVATLAYWFSLLAV